MPLIRTKIQGPVLLDRHGLPRYWATIWSMFDLNGLASSTQRALLAHVEALYAHTEASAHLMPLDDVLADINISALEAILESFFLSIRNVPDPGLSADRRWRTAFRFVGSTIERIQGCTPGRQHSLDQCRLRLEHLDRLYSHLRVSRARPTPRIRALPSHVVASLYELANPESDSNPFRNNRTRWNVWVCFIMLLHLGLRRGELLALPVDAVKQEQNDGKYRYWLDVRSNVYQQDPRSSVPSFKTANSIRQIPVTEKTASLIRLYIENYRGKPDHSFLISSSQNHPDEACRDILVRTCTGVPRPQFTGAVHGACAGGYRHPAGYRTHRVESVASVSGVSSGRFCGVSGGRLASASFASG